MKKKKKEIEIKSKKPKSIIHIDNREKDDRVFHMFDSQPFFDVKIEYLELGDIMFDSCVIERKSFQDFMSSINRERFWLNLKDMKENFDSYFLWLDASDYDAMKYIEDSCRRGYKYSYNKYIGAKISTMLMGIPIIQFPKIENASEFFIKTFQKLDKEKDHLPITNLKKSGVPIEKRRIESISRIEGIGNATAEFLLAQYGTIEKLIKASKKDNKDKNANVLKSVQDFFCE